MVATKATSKNEINDISCNALKAVAQAYMGRFGTFDVLANDKFTGTKDSEAKNSFIEHLTDTLNDDVFMKNITTVPILPPSSNPNSSALSADDATFLAQHNISYIGEISTHQLFNKDPDQLFVYYIPVKKNADNDDDMIAFSFTAEDKDGAPDFKREPLELGSTLTDEYTDYKTLITSEPQFKHIQTWVKGQAIVNHKIGKSTPTDPSKGPPNGDRTGIESLSYQAQYHTASEYFKKLTPAEFDISTYSEIFWSPSTNKFTIVGEDASGNNKKITMKYDVDADNNFLAFHYRDTSLIEVSKYDEGTDKQKDIRFLETLLDELKLQSKEDNYIEIDNNGYLEYLRQIKEASKTTTLSDGENYRRNAETIEKVPRVLTLALSGFFDNHYTDLSTTKAPTQKSQRVRLQTMLKQSKVTDAEFTALNALAFLISEDPVMGLNVAELDQIIKTQSITSTATNKEDRIKDINEWWVPKVNIKFHTV